jgi:2-haloacid dehalogenase
VVSGEEKTRKPFRDIYDILLSRHGLDPEMSLFIDDNMENVKAAERIGIRALLFRRPEQLRADLKNLKVI